MGVYCSYMFQVGLVNPLTYHSESMATITLKIKSWATFKLCLCHLSSLNTRNYQYSMMIEMRGTSSMIGGVQVLNVIQFGEYILEKAHLLKNTAPL